MSPSLDDQGWLGCTAWIRGGGAVRHNGWVASGSAAGRARDARASCQGTLGDQGHLRDPEKKRGTLRK